jgi:hypothetical protein
LKLFKPHGFGPSGTPVPTGVNYKIKHPDKSKFDKLDLHKTADFSKKHLTNQKKRV